MLPTEHFRRSSLSVLAAASAFGGLFAGPGAPAPIAVVGDPVRLEIGKEESAVLGSSDGGVAAGLARARAFDFVPQRSGTVTVLVESADGDVLVRRVDAAGTAIAEDDDGGVEWNARLETEVVAGEAAHFVAGFKGPRQGSLRIVAREGAVPELSGVELDEARARFFRERGRARLAEGKKLLAAVDLHEAGQLDLLLGQYARCRQSYDTVLELAEELDHSLLRAVAQAHLGAVHLEFHELGDAISMLGRAVAGSLEVRNGLVEMLAQSKLGEARLALGDHGAARTCLERALALAREAGDQGNEIVLCSRMGQVAWREKDAAGAKRWHEQAIALARELAEPMPLAGALLDAGRFDEELCHYARARELLEEALAAAPTLKLQAAALGHLGNLALHTGDSPTAIEHYERVLTAAQQLGDAGLESAALLSLAHCDDRMGDFERARQRLGNALALLPGAGLPNERARILRSFGIVLTETGDFDAARRNLDEALNLARQSSDPRLEALCLNAIVSWHYHRREFAEAMDPARRQHAIGRELGLADVEACALEDTAELSLRCGDLVSARADADRAVAMFRELGNPRYLQAALLTLVEIVEREGDAEAMAAIVAEAEGCFENIEGPQVDPEKASLLRAQDVFALWGEYSQDLVSLSLVSGSSTSDESRSILEDGFRRAGLWKGRALLQGIAEHRRGARNARTIALRRERREVLAEREGTLARLAATLREKEPPADAVRELQSSVDALELRAGELLAELREIAPADAALDAPRGVTPKDLAGFIGEEDVLVEFADGRRHLYAYVLRGGRLSFHELGKREDVDALVSDFLAGVTRPERLAPVGEIAKRGRELYERLLTQTLADGVSPSARLIVVPTASLAVLPFEALVADAPELPKSFEDLVFVLDRREVHYVASTPVLALLASAEPRKSKGPALILADPISPAETLDGSLRGPSEDRADWGRLPGTRAESAAVAAALESTLKGSTIDALRQEISDQLGSRRSVSLSGETYRLHIGADATPNRLRGDLREFAILHFASHGWVDPANPRRSGLLLSPGEHDDGTLSVADILDLDLDADMTVLSACETGRGAVRRGEGVQSMARAFLYAGSRSVVASLWKVDDLAAEQVMARFYSVYAARGLGPTSALREARLSVRHHGADRSGPRGLAPGRLAAEGAGALLSGHPYAWAPFVVFGPPRAASAVRSK